MSALSPLTETVRGDAPRSAIKHGSLGSLKQPCINNCLEAFAGKTFCVSLYQRSKKQLRRQTYVQTGPTIS